MPMMFIVMIVVVHEIDLLVSIDMIKQLEL